MVYAMIVYNIAGDQGGLSLQTFSAALGELIIMVPLAFLIEFLVVGRIAPMIAFRHMTPQDKPIFITFFISGVTVAFMCPIMSFFATMLFQGVNGDLFTNWLSLTAHNLPMAFFWQFLYAGPFVRLIFQRVVMPIIHSVNARRVDTATE